MARARSVSAKRFSKTHLRLLSVEHPYPADVERPKTRADCATVARPCPFVSCAHHLFLDVSPRTGSIKMNFPYLEPDEMARSCALDIADEGGATLSEVGRALNLTRERARQVEEIACRKLRLTCVA